MNLLEQTKIWCAELNLVPRKGLGQNFLIAEKVLAQIMELADLKKTETVLEIGPGLGILTEQLLARAGRVIALEKDQKLFEFLKRRFADKLNLRLILGDALTWSGEGEEKRSLRLRSGHASRPDMTSGLRMTKSIEMAATANILAPGQYQIIANLPYSITGAFLTRFLTKMPPPSRMILMLQKEVAEKLCAQAGEMSLLAVLVQFYTQPRKAFKVSRGHFWPQPIVDSAIVDFKWQPLDSEENLRAAWPLVQAGFSSPRKKLKNNLAGRWPEADWSGRWERLGWESGRRAEDLNVQDWLDLFRHSRENGNL